MKSFLFPLLVMAIAIAVILAVLGPGVVLRAFLAPAEAYAERFLRLGITPQLKSLVVIAPASTTNGATVTGNIDTLGFDWLTLDVYQATSDSTSNNLSTCKLSESDDTVVTNFADIAKFVGDGADGFTIPNADTSAGQLYKFNVDLRGRKRYLKLTLTPTTTQILAGIANLGRGEQAPVSASDAGVGALVEG